MPGGASRFDYQSIDEANRRLYISHMGASAVVVFGIDANKVVANIGGVPRPTGVLVVPDLNRVFVSASAGDKVYLIDAAANKIIASVPTKSFPDGIAYDPKSKRAFVSDESGRAVTVIDATTDRVISNIELGGEVGNTHYDPASKLIYSAVQTRGELVALNPQTLKIIGRYNLPGCKGPHGFYIVEETHDAFITGEDNATYVVFDLTSHKIIAHGKVGSGPDVLAYDRMAHRLFVASESGIVSAFEVHTGGVRKIGEVFFASHAHSVSVDDTTGLVFFPLQNVDGRPILRVMKIVVGKS
ncbi:MAG: YncE family protein [Bacteroidota bacterium]|nr:YncE family protein [Bacteroidota bacterium]